MAKNLTVGQLIDKVLSLLTPIVIIREEGAGQIYSGPITSIPDNIKNRNYVQANIDILSGEIIIILGGAVKDDDIKISICQ